MSDVCCVNLLLSADLSDPSKFTSQMRKESKSPGTPLRPSIKRHGTVIRFSETKRQSSMNLNKSMGSVGLANMKLKGGEGGRAVSHPNFPVQGGSRISLGSVSTPLDEKDEGGLTEVSVELDSCVSSMELVQLQLDKTSEAWHNSGGDWLGGLHMSLVL